MKLPITTAAEFDAYLKWRSQQQCEDCGAKYADRPRNAAGVTLDVWATETLCGDCHKKRCAATQAKDRA